MKKILLALLLIFICDCSSKHDIDETDIMWTVCIDGIKHLSVFNGLDCYYHPLEINGELVRCDETRNDKM